MENKFSGMIPLAIFTSFLPMAIGIVLGITISYLVEPIAVEEIIIGLMWTFIFTFSGGIVVLFHLGHAQKGMYIFRGLSHSALSLEVVLTGFFSAFIVACILLSYKIGPGVTLLIFLSLVSTIGIVTSFTIGKVYNLQPQISWRGPVASLGPAISSVNIALMVAFVVINDPGVKTIFYILFVIAIFDDVLFTVIRLQKFVVLLKSRFGLVFQKQKVLTIVCYIVKIVLMVCAGVLLKIGYRKEALFFVGYGVFIDRMGFYGSAVMETPRESIAVIKEERMRKSLSQ